MAKLMHDIVNVTIAKVVNAIDYNSISCDESTCVDNQS
jgi:hypothetical protein